MQKKFLFSFILIMFFFTHTNSEVISGNATIIDGDTIKINSKCDNYRNYYAYYKKFELIFFY